MLALDATGVAAALASAGSWAVGSFLFKSLGEILPPLAMTLAKGICSSVLLGTMMVAMGSGVHGFSTVVLLTISGFLGISLGDTFFFASLNRLGPVPLLVLAVLGQVMTIFAALLFLHESPTRSAWIGVVLVISGVAIVLRANLKGDARATGVSGLAFGLLSVICMSASSIIVKVALDESSDTVQASFIRMLAGTLGVFAVGLTTGRLTSWTLPLRDVRVLLLFIASVAVVTLGGFWLSMVAYKRLPVSIASCLTSTEPVFGLVLAAALFREKITSAVVCGTFATVLGVVFICSPDLESVFGKGLFLTTPGG